MEAETAGGVRARVRAQLVDEIKAAARRQLAEVGAAALSLRAVAREVGMVSSAVYRYFPSRDQLLTALIVDAYDAVGTSAEEAERRRPRGDLMGRWMATCRAVRAWALANPYEYALVYGSPVPGYAAPADTIDPAARVSLVLIGILVDGVASGQVATEPAIATTRALRHDFAGLREQVAPGVPDEVIARALGAWTQMFGSISYELFGHLHNVVNDYDAFFELEMSEAGERMLSLSGPR